MRPDAFSVATPSGSPPDAGNRRAGARASMSPLVGLDPFVRIFAQDLELEYDPDPEYQDILARYLLVVPACRDGVATYALERRAWTRWPAGNFCPHWDPLGVRLRSRESHVDSLPEDMIPHWRLRLLSFELAPEATVDALLPLLTCEDATLRLQALAALASVPG